MMSQVSQRPVQSCAIAAVAHKLQSKNRRDRLAHALYDSPEHHLDLLGDRLRLAGAGIPDALSCVRCRIF